MPVKCTCLTVNPNAGVELYYCYDVLSLLCSPVITDDNEWTLNHCGCLASCPSSSGSHETTKHCCPGYGSCPTTTTPTTTTPTTTTTTTTTTSTPKKTTTKPKIKWIQFFTKPKTTTKKPNKRCFPSAAKIILENGKSITMSELKVGDMVQTVTDGVPTHIDVTRFVKKEHTTMTLYKSITTSSNKTICLTGNHLIYTRKMYSQRFSAINADLVSIGDDLLVQTNDELSADRVINVSHLTMQGAYLPLIKEGNFIVDGILASCYPSTDHDLSHLAMTPMLWFPELMELIFGEDNGAKTYVNIATDVGGLVLPYGLQN